MLIPVVVPIFVNQLIPVVVSLFFHFYMIKWQTKFLQFSIIFQQPHFFFIIPLFIKLIIEIILLNKFCRSLDNLIPQQKAIIHGPWICYLINNINIHFSIWKSIYGIHEIIQFINFTYSKTCKHSLLYRMFSSISQTKFFTCIRDSVIIFNWVDLWW